MTRRDASHRSIQGRRLGRAAVGAGLMLAILSAAPLRAENDKSDRGGADGPGRRAEAGGARSARISSPVDELRERLDSVKLILFEMEYTSKRAEDLDQQLTEQKNMPPTGPYLDELMKERKIEGLQAQLHLTIDRFNGLKAQRRDLAKAILDRRSETLDWLNSQKQSKTAELQKANDSAIEASRLRVELNDLEYYRELLESLGEDAESAERVLCERFSDPSATAAGAGRPGLRSSSDRRAAPRPTGRALILEYIRSLEAEQQRVLRIWQQNEANLRRYRRLLEEADDSPIKGANESSPSPGALPAAEDPPTGAPAPLLRPEALVQGRPRPAATRD